VPCPENKKIKYKTRKQKSRRVSADLYEVVFGNHTSEHSEKLVVSRFKCAILQTMTNILSSILMLPEFTYLVCKFTGPGSPHCQDTNVFSAYKFSHFVGFTIIITDFYCIAANRIIRQTQNTMTYFYFIKM